MLRRFWTAVFVFLLIAIFASSVSAAPAENKSVTLISTTFNSGTGIVLLFQSSGLTQKDLKNASVFAHSNEYPMSCGFKDETSVVRCIIPGGLTQYAGESLSGTLAGFRFWSKIPERKADQRTCPEGQSLWYTVNVYFDGELGESGDLPAEFYGFLLDLLASYPEEFEGITLEVAGQFCGEEVVIDLPE